MDNELRVENDGGGQLVYTIGKNGLIIKKYRGIAQKITVPPYIDGQPVVSIEKKAFLSCKTINEIILPDTVNDIGDWAFAHTEQLRVIILPEGELKLGKEIFLGCNNLREIIFNTTVEGKEYRAMHGIWRMLAIAVTVLHDYFMLDNSMIETDEWISRWDNKLLKLIETDDLDGYEELWTCGEEDYEGKEYDIKSYPVEKRKMKLRIVYFRLMHKYKISDSVKERLENYLKAYTKGEASCEAWDIIKEEHHDDLEYYKVFTRSGCVTDDNFDEIFADMNNTGAEIKAYMLRYKEENLCIKNAFEAFELNW